MPLQIEQAAVYSTTGPAVDFLAPGQVEGQFTGRLHALTFERSAPACADWVSRSKTFEALLRHCLSHGARV